MLDPLFIVGFLIAHAAIHLAFLSPAPPVTADGPTWPFATGETWPVTRFGVDQPVLRSLVAVLVALTVGAFALAAVVALGFLPSALWVPSIAVGSVASLAVLAIGWQPILVLGAAIDLGLLWATVGAGWMPSSPGLGA